MQVFWMVWSQYATLSKVLSHRIPRIDAMLREIVRRVLFIDAQKLYLQRLLLMMQQ